MRKVLMFVIGTLSGVAIGVAVALMISPLSGEAMREEARLQFDEMLAEAQRAADVKRVELEAEYADLTTHRH